MTDRYKCKAVSDIILENEIIKENIYSTKYGLKYKIINLINASNISIKFIKTGYIINNISYREIETKHIYHPLIVEKLKYNRSRITDINKNLSFIISNEDVERVLKYKWNKTFDNYISARINGSTISLHRFITNCPKNKIVHHYNRLKYDNCRENLKIMTRNEHTKLHLIKKKVNYNLIKFKEFIVNNNVCSYIEDFI